MISVKTVTKLLNSWNATYSYCRHPIPHWFSNDQGIAERSGDLASSARVGGVIWFNWVRENTLHLSF